MILEVQLVWDYQQDRVKFEGFANSYPALFDKLKKAGWTGGKLPRPLPGPARLSWARAAELFVLHPTALDFLLVFEGLELEASYVVGDLGPYTSHVRFYPGRAFASMKTSAFDYDEDITDILEDPDPFPVAESAGKVLFITPSCRAAFIDQSLCGYIRAPEPFMLLNAVLFNVGSDLVERDAVPFGDRVTGRSM